MKPESIVQSNKMTKAEYNRILAFLYEIQSSQSLESLRANLLNNLIKYFGYSCSSMWMVNEDLTLSDPIGVNMDRNLMEDYLHFYHNYDDFHPQKLGASIINGHVSVVDFDNFAQWDLNNPYISTLSKYHIKHQHALLLRHNGNICAAIALFKPTEKKSYQRDFLNPSCLEVVAPFIAEEFGNNMRLTQAIQTINILKNVLDITNTGIILFEHTDSIHVPYYNPICTRYCSNFIRNANSHTVVSQFLQKVVIPYGVAIAGLSDLTVNLTSLNGKKYSLRIIDNGSHAQNLLTVFLKPLENAPSTIKLNIQNVYSLFTPREHEVTILIMQGLTNKQIADQLCISISTVKSHIKRIFEKTNAVNRSSLISMLYNGNE